MKNLRHFFYFVLICHVGMAQNKISGIVKDSKTQQAIPFASIGIVGTQLGTLSDGNGNFELPLRNFTDSVRISSIGYSYITLAGSELQNSVNKIFHLKPEAYQLKPVEVNAKNSQYKILGTSKYSKDVCTAFVGQDANWRGEQAAILAHNKDTGTVYIESFGFYIIKNTYADSLQFRIMLYEVNDKGYPGKTFLQKPLLFKTNTKQGEVRIDVSSYFITTNNDFFISLECLEEKMEAGKFCFAGSIKVPSFVKTTPFAKWVRVKGGGGDFNVKVSCVKE
jgi:hypothetical protein